MKDCYYESRYLILFQIVCFCPNIYSLEWVATLSNAFVLGVPAYQLYRSTKIKYFPSTSLPISLSDEKHQDALFASSQKIANQVESDTAVRHGAQISREILSGITGMPTVSFVTKTSEYGHLSAAVAPMEDVNGVQAVFLAASTDFYKSAAQDKKYVEAILYHEAGHVVLKHHEKYADISHKINTASFIASAAFWCVLAYNPPETPRDKIGFNLYFTGLQGAAQFLIKQYYSRKNECEADDYAIKHCKNADALETFGLSVLGHYAREQYKNRFLGLLFEPLYALMHKTIESHPAANARAHLLMQAANKLRHQGSSASL